MEKERNNAKDRQKIIDKGLIDLSLVQARQGAIYAPSKPPENPLRSFVEIFGKGGFPTKALRSREAMAAAATEAALKFAPVASTSTEAALTNRDLTYARLDRLSEEELELFELVAENSRKAASKGIPTVDAAKIGLSTIAPIEGTNIAIQLEHSRRRLDPATLPRAIGPDLTGTVKGLPNWSAGIINEKAKERAKQEAVERSLQEEKNRIIGLLTDMEVNGQSAGYDDAYKAARTFGMSHDGARKVAEGVAEANEMLDADIRNLREAASWMAVPEKNEEQNINKQPESLDKAALDKAFREAPLTAALFSAAELESMYPGLRETRERMEKARASTEPMETPKGLFDVAALMTGREPPGMLETPIGPVAVGWPEGLHTKEVTEGLMRSTAYANPSHPQSKPVRDTVKGFFQSAYKGPAAVDEFGRIDLGPAVSRPASAPEIFRGKSALARRAAPVASASPAAGQAGLIDRQESIKTGLVDSGSLWDAVQKETDARRAAERQVAAAARDRRELQTAREINQRRDTLARKADTQISVMPPETDILGTPGNKVTTSAPEQLDAENEAAALVAARTDAIARAARNRSEKKVDAKNGLNPDSVKNLSGSSDGEGWGGERAGRGGDHGSEGFVPGREHPQIVTSAGGLVKSGSGANVTTGGVRNDPLVGGPSDNGPDTRVICTELVRQGLMDAELYYLDLRFAEERLKPAHLRGYHLWAVPLVRWMRRSPRVTRITAAPARWRAEEVAYLLGARPKGNFKGRVLRLIGEPLCRLIGAVAPETDYRKLYERETAQ